VSWEVSDETVTLREMTGIGIQFTNVKYDFPLPPAGYYRSHGATPVQRRLEPHGVLRVPIPRVETTGDAEYEFLGIDDLGRPITVTVRVKFRALE
jgi:hypothetical protein